MSNSWDPLGCNSPGSSVHGIFQAGLLEWVAISFFRGSFQPRDRTGISWFAGGFFITGPTGKPVKIHTACQSSSRKLWQHSIYKGRRVRRWGFSLPPSDDSQAVLSLFQLNPECLHLSFQEIFCVVYLTLLEYRYSERRPKNQKKKDFSKHFCKKHESLAFWRSLQ